MEVTKIDNLIDENKDEIFSTLETIVNIDSFTHDKQGANKLSSSICEKLRSLNIEFKTKSNEVFGDHIIALVKGSKKGRILLLGHYDTPHPPGTVKERPYQKVEDVSFGPGVSDMKAGLVSMIYAAAAIKKSGIEICDIELLFTPDEEYGSPVSKKIIEERAKNTLAVFNLESGRPDGSVVTSRRGSAHFTFDIVGKASHSGVAYNEGISAIEELGYKIIEFKKLNNLNKGINVNVGTVSGGSNTNVVPSKASGSIHVSYSTKREFEDIKAQMKRIIDTSYISGTKSTLSGGTGISPMEKTEEIDKLFHLVKNAAAMHGIVLTEKSEKGAADAGFVASMGIPVICGMGPVGGKWHSVDEYMVNSSFLPRIKMLISSILGVAAKN